MKNIASQAFSKGFTLIELMIAVAIMGILVSVAYPAYTDFVQRSNRTEGQRELLRIAGLMEQYFLDNRTYTKDLKNLGYSASTVTTENGYYSIEATAGDANVFTLTATAKGSQASDTSCKTMTLTNTGAKTPSPSTYDCWE